MLKSVLVVLVLAGLAAPAMAARIAQIQAAAVVEYTHEVIRQPGLLTKGKIRFERRGDAQRRAVEAAGRKAVEVCTMRLMQNMQGMTAEKYRKLQPQIQQRLAGQYSKYLSRAPNAAGVMNYVVRPVQAKEVNTTKRLLDDRFDRYYVREFHYSGVFDVAESKIRTLLDDVIKEGVGGIAGTVAKRGRIMLTYSTNNAEIVNNEDKRRRFQRGCEVFKSVLENAMAKRNYRIYDLAGVRNELREVFAEIEGEAELTQFAASWQRRISLYDDMAQANAGAAATRATGGTALADGATFLKQFCDVIIALQVTDFVEQRIAGGNTRISINLQVNAYEAATMQKIAGVTPPATRAIGGDIVMIDAFRAAARVVTREMVPALFERFDRKPPELRWRVKFLKSIPRTTFRSIRRSLADKYKGFKASDLKREISFLHQGEGTALSDSITEYLETRGIEADAVALDVARQVLVWRPADE
jgi:hypothetical protein